jgi:hypothetical protein
MIGKKMVRILKIILVIMIMTRPDAAIIMIAGTEIELTEKGERVKLLKRSLERRKIIGKLDV